MNFRHIDLTGFHPADAPADQMLPTMLWADVSALTIDTRYQRALTAKGRNIIARIARGWDWKKYQPILIAPGDAGQFAVVDGQHRAHAAALCGITALPAMMVPMTLREQAASFVAVNRDRISLDRLAVYRAELQAGMEWAIAASKAVEAGGCRIATANPSAAFKKPRDIYAIGLIRRMIEAGEGEAITAGLAGISNSMQGAQIEAYAGPILSAWLPAIATNQRFMRLELAAVFDAIDFADLYDDAIARSRMAGGSARGRVIDVVVGRLHAAHQRASA
ncbi:ParB/RepB/Spo0J family partition protein [Pararhodobacter zhoushanensis]|uniref:ParB/RepB/Spo0J family partition protein n=1 Tax=Pararhodobacter zhoushanensis TaxID=2479545 RepID=A0ABT3GYM8_9RHOB|nr:ParB/RepB/Spo0J family partition protein [Pararhodobacter zhoushanensis]MCW1932632.1 ParB/RepB/Spo0J family partition protein [Pararhodobacter zhoushanensis]